VGDDLRRAEEAHGDERAAAVHERLGEPRHAHEGVAGNVHGARESLARAVDHAAMQVLGGRIGDGMQHEVEPAPLAVDRLEGVLHLAGLLDVERHRDGGIERRGKRLHVGPRLLVEPGHGELRSQLAKHARASPGDAALVRDADHEALAAREQRRHELQRGRDSRIHQRTCP